MITSPWRSTKCSAAITNPSVLVNHGVTQSRSAATAQRTSCVRPPTIPPASTSAAAERLKGTMRRIAATSETDVPFAYIPPCSSTTTRYPSPNASPFGPYAVGIASETTRNAPIPPSRSSRKRRRSVAIAFVNHA